MEDISLGGRKSPPDYRDVQLAAVVGKPQKYPGKYFNDIKKLPVWHQRKIGACVGHAIGKYKQKLDLVDDEKLTNLSARFLYALAKCRDDYSGEGTYPRLVMKILQDHGCATEATVPNDTKLTHEDYVYLRDEKKIPETAWKDAIKAKIKSYAFVTITKDGLKQAIIEANGCALLVQVGEEWYKDKNGKKSWLKKDILPIRPPKVVISGHEVWLYGYEDEGDDTKFYILNSWSDDWGDKGTGYFYWSQYKSFINEGVTAIDIPNSILDEVHDLPPADKFKHTFTTTLLLGQTSAEVKALQTALKIEKFFPIGQPETGYYGPITQDAVRKFQRFYKVASEAELIAVDGKVVGPKTIKKLNELFS